MVPRRFPHVRVLLPTVFAWAVALTLTVSPAGAQAAATQNPDSVRASHEPLFVPTDALYAAGFVLGTVAMAPLDLRIANALQRPSRQTNQFLRNTATGFRLLGNPGPLIVAGSTYVVGRVAHHRELADVGLHSAESLAMAEALTNLLKGTVGRARPSQDPDDPHNFSFGRGIHKDLFRSFPSGHSSAAFATAASLSAEISRIYPHARFFVKPLLYGGATLVGVSRLYNNQHWASDVVAGAAIGTFSGWKIVRYNHTHPDNPVDRRLLPARVSPNANGGVTLTWSFRGP